MSSWQNSGSPEAVSRVCMQSSGHHARLRGCRVQSVRAVVHAQERPAQHEVLCRTAAYDARDADVWERARQLHASNVLRGLRCILHAALGRMC